LQFSDIKKVGALKLIHRKWREKDSEEEKSRFLSEFNEAIHYNEELSAYVSKAHEGKFSFLCEAYNYKISNFFEG